MLEIKQSTIFTILNFYGINAMSNSQNSNISEKEKQIVFRVSEAEHQKIRIKAAVAGSLTPNQFAKKFILESLDINLDDESSDQKQS